MEEIDDNCSWPSPEPAVKDNVWRESVWLCRASRSSNEHTEGDRDLWLRYLNKVVVGTPMNPKAVEWFTERSGAPAWQVEMLRDTLVEGSETWVAARRLTEPARLDDLERALTDLAERGVPVRADLLEAVRRRNTPNPDASS